MADSLTKVFSSVKHKVFIEITKIKDQKNFLASIKRDKNSQNAFQQLKANLEYSKIYRFSANTI